MQQICLSAELKIKFEKNTLFFFFLILIILYM
jgi:hypothetical protein